MAEPPTDWFLLTSNSLASIVLPWAVGQYVRQLAELRDAGWELAQRLEREQDRAAGQVRIRERARIAADMHDSLGHELSLIAVRAAALQVTPGIGAEGRWAAGALRSAAESATDRLREIIGMLREEGDEPPVSPRRGRRRDQIHSADARGARGGFGHGRERG